MCDGVWAIIYSNYEPAEVDSIWSTKEAAQEYMDRELNDNAPWHIVYWRVEDN